MALIRACKSEGCERSFSSTRRNKVYCPTCTALAMCPRQCQHAPCSRLYTVKSAAYLDSKYCSIPCSLAANRQIACDAAAKARVGRGRVEVECALVASGQCLHPDELISVVRSQSEMRKYHIPDCNEIGYETGDRREKKSALRFCEKCDKPIGYHFPSSFTKYCRDCGLGTCKGQTLPRGRGAWHTCAWRGCANQIYAAPWRAKLSKAGLFYCKDHDGRRARHTATRVRCTKCPNVREYYTGRVPTSVDPATRTWICPACRSYKTVGRAFECAQCDRSFTRRVKTSTPVPDPDARPLCLDCRRADAEKKRAQAPPCDYCKKVIQRRGRHKKYCDWTCYRAAKKGRTGLRYRPSKAQQRIVAAQQGGARGVRPLARASHTSPVTVQNLIKLGKIAS